MKIAISSTGTDLNAAVDPRFGRCANLIIVDVDSGEFEVVVNQNAQAGGGAGIQTAQLVSDKGAEAVLTGNVGPNAIRTLTAAEIKVYSGVSGTVQAAIDSYKSGSLKPVDSATKPGHW